MGASFADQDRYFSALYTVAALECGKLVLGAKWLQQGACIQELSGSGYRIYAQSGLVPYFCRFTLYVVECG